MRSSFCPHYTNGIDKSPVLHKLIEPYDIVTIDFDFLRKPSLDVGRTKTIFKEISIVPYEIEYAEEHTEARLIPNVYDKPVEDREYLDTKKFVAGFEKAVIKGWDANKFHIVFHSSGYDSKLLGYVIKKLYKETNPRILFICYGPEAENVSFRKIMEYEGWEPFQYAIMPFDYEDFYNFETIWRHVNCGMMPRPFNPFQQIVEILRKSFYIPQDPDDLIIWTGYGGNPVWKDIRRRESLDGHCKRWQYSKWMTMFGYVDGKYIRDPFSDLEAGKIAYQYTEDKGDKTSRITRERIIKELDTELHAIPKGEAETHKFSKETYYKMIIDFKNSYYYQNIRQPIIYEYSSHVNVKSVEFFWYEWTLASLIEELLRRNVHIL